MSAKKFKFIFLLTLLAVFIFLTGEILLFFLLPDAPAVVSKAWLIAVVVITLGISLWKCPRDYRDD